MMRPDPGIPEVYLCIKPVDFRKAIQGLSLLIEQELELNPFETTLFVFITVAVTKSKSCTGKKMAFAFGIKACKNNVSSGPEHMTLPLSLSTEKS